MADLAAIREYEAAKAARQLTPEETELVPWEQVKADYDARHGALSDQPS